MDELRSEICSTFWKNTQVPRREIFGDRDILPSTNVEHSDSMWAGYVGRRYQRGGILLLANFPAGGTDAYSGSERDLRDAKFYDAIRAFKQSNEASRISAFEALNDICGAVLPQWNIYRLIGPVTKILGLSLAQVAYVNAVPYRIAGNKQPSVSAARQAWDKCTAHSIDVLAPKAIAALGVASGRIALRHHSGRAKIYVLPRRIGDSSIHPEALSVSHRMSNEVREA
jgi:hypothetical protein